MIKAPFFKIPLAHLICFFLLTAGLSLQAQKPVNGPSNIAKNWKLGIAMWTFHNFTFEEAVAKADSANVDYVEGFSFQKSIKELNDTTIAQLSPAGVDKLKRFLKAKNMKMASMYAFGGKTVDAWKKEFDRAKQLGLKFITAEPPPALYKSVDSLAGIYGIKVAIHNHWKEISPASWHPDTLLVTLRKYPNFGACADVGHMLKSGVDPLESIKKLNGRILAIHLKDIGEKNNIKAIDVPVGTGLVNFPEIFKELKRQHFNGYIYIERDADEKPSNLPSVIRTVKYYNDQLGLRPNLRAIMMDSGAPGTKE
jgi:sugar phosphate isomerase/epimerase